MNTDVDLSRWLPCQSRCELAGAASLFLSIKNSSILINGPRWCAMVAEREMAAAEKKYEKQMFCSEVKEVDLLYGADEAMQSALDEIKNEQKPDLIAVLNSCSVSLIGDDLKGICKSADMGCPVIPMDSGGLRGEFWHGYQIAAQKLLESLNLKTDRKRKNNKVNIIGWCTAYPNWLGDLLEIKRMLQKINIEVGICFGADGVAMKDLEELPEAAINVVLHPELGLNAVEFLKERLGQEYVIAPIPYGMQNSLQWLQKITAALNMQPDFSAIENEIAYNQEKIDTAIFQLKANNKNISFGNAYLCLTQGMAMGIVKALVSEFPDLNDIYLRLEGPVESSIMSEIFYLTREWKGYSDKHIRKNYLDLVLGNTQTRVEAANYKNTVFMNVLLPYQGVVVHERPYAGITGWKFLLADIFDKFQTLAYLNPVVEDDRIC